MIDHQTRAHSSIGASSAYRWFACPGSVRLTKGMISVSSPFALEGTAAHELAEYCLRTGITDMQSRDAKEHANWTEEMAEHLQIYLDTVWSYRKPGTELEIERRFHLTEIDDEAFGTNDAMVYDAENGHLVVIDLKYGRGIPVEAEGNLQLLYYALGAATSKHNYPLKTVEMVIVQPRCPHPDGPVRTWTVDAAYLLDWAGDLQEAIEATRDPNAPLVAGKHCRYCLGAGFCEAYSVHSLQSARIDFEDPADMSEAELADTLEKANTVEAWIKAVRKYAYDRAMAGSPPTGYKLVAKRYVRKWADEKHVVEYMHSRGFGDRDIFERKLKSPAQLEKLVDKDDRAPLEDYQIRESSGLTLVSVHDRRPAVTPNAADDFAE